MAQQQLNSYSDVQNFFRNFVTANQISIGDAPHDAFWDALTYDQFVNGNVPNVPGPIKILVSGDAANSNLLKILQGPLTVGGNSFSQMPEGGPFTSTDMIATLVDWIDRNCPNP